MGKVKFNNNDIDHKKLSETIVLNGDSCYEKAHPDEDCGWAWVVFGAVFIGRTIILGTLLTFSIYFAHYLEVFGSSRSFTGLIGSIMWFLYDLSGLINSVIIRRIGPRLSVIIGSIVLMSSFLLSTLATDIYHLMLTQGILLGVSSNLVNLSFVMGLKTYFRKHLNLAQGISTSGAGIGVFILGQIIPNLLDNYGWRGACVIHSGILLNITVVGAMLFPPKQAQIKHMVVNTKAQLSFQQGWCALWHTSRFWLLVMAYFCFNFSYVTSIVLYKDFVNVRQLAEHFSAALIAFGAGDIAGRFSSGVLSSWRRINLVILFASTHLLCGSLLLFQMVLVQCGLSLITVSFFFGFGTGCANGLFFIVPSCMYDNDIFLIAFALCGAFGGLGSIISTPIAGAIIDSTKSYAGALGMASISSFLAAILLLVLFFTHLDKNVYPHFVPQGSITRV